MAAAEDALATALEKALALWPTQGVPDAPDAWLLTVARRELLQAARRNRLHASPQVQALLDGEPAHHSAPALPDSRLTLLFVCAHPAIDAAVRPALMLQAVLGLQAQQIAQAMLTSPAAMAQRLVRAKQKDPRRRPALRGARPGRVARAPACRAGGGVRRLWPGLGRDRQRRWRRGRGRRAARPAQRGVVSGRPGVQPAAGQRPPCRGRGFAGADPVLRGPRAGPARTGWRLCTAGRAGHRRLAAGHDRARQPGAGGCSSLGRTRPVPAGGGHPVGALPASRHRPHPLGRHRPAVPTPAGHRTQSGRRGGPCRGLRAGGRCATGAGIADRPGLAPAGQLPAVLGGAGPRGRTRRAP